MDITKELPTVISFCSGYGGIERGLDLTGLEHRVLAYVEIEAFVIANLVAKMESGELVPAPIFTDLKTFPAHLFRGAVDIITGGYPCQPFSAAGKRRGTDDPRHLWPHIRRHTQAIRPSRVFFENVEGHISLGLSSVISDLEEDGYRSAWGIFSAREVGAPHQRKRVYIMGDSEYNGLFAPEKRGSDSEDGYRAKEGQLEAIQSERAGEPQSCRDLSGGQELAYPRCGASSEGVKQAKLWSIGAGESPESTRKKCGQTKNVQGQKWPAGPNQEQYEWEQPRTVWKTKPELGGTLDGHSNRVDRLRLLGNGVVPQTAAKAWTVLNNQLFIFLNREGDR